MRFAPPRLLAHWNHPLSYLDKLFGFFFKRRITIAAYNVDFLCGPDNRPATGANIFPGTTGFLASRDMGDCLSVKVKFGVAQALDKGFRFIGQNRLTVPIFGGFLDDQSVGFRRFLEFFCCGRTRPGLYPESPFGSCKGVPFHEAAFQPCP